MKELEWTIIFDFPRDELDMHGYIPLNDNTYVPFNPGDESLKNAKVWTNKKDAEKFASEHCGKYAWQLFPTVIESVIY